jgi:hypothetical protein
MTTQVLQHVLRFHLTDLYMPPIAPAPPIQGVPVVLSKKRGGSRPLAIAVPATVAATQSILCFVQRNRFVCRRCDTRIR